SRDTCLMLSHTFVCPADHLFIYKRTGAVMDKNIPLLFGFLEPIPNRGITFIAARNDSADFRKPVLIHNIFLTVLFFPFSGDQNDLIDQPGILKRFERIEQYWSAAHQKILFMYLRPHTPAAPGCKHDRRTVFLFHMLIPLSQRSPSFRFGTAFRSHPCLVPARNS